MLGENSEVSDSSGSVTVAATISPFAAFAPRVVVNAA